MGILSKIIASKEKELAELRSTTLPQAPSSVPALQLHADEQWGVKLICEIKRKSPSAGALSSALSISERAHVYQTHGAAMISVLCDGPFFDGSFQHLLQARQGCDLPLLCKEFVIDEIQLEWARACGASAVLLIVRCLSPTRLGELIAASKARDLVPLVEVFTEEEAQIALDQGATMIGVNARDLDTLVMDSARATRIVESLPTGVVAAHLSGIKSPEDVAALRDGRADAALIGEVLMRKDDPSALLASLHQASRRAL